jgi:hypothetical protein
MTDPLTPPDCDLRDYPWMPLDCGRLLTSETWVLGNSDEKVAALTLWLKSWHQVPAGSLPSNDKMLHALSEAGGRWSRVRDHALRGWVLCSDGRLYHPVVAEKANESWQMKLARKARTEAARAAKADRRSSLSAFPQSDVTVSVTEPVTEVVTGSTGQDRTVQDQTRQDTSFEREDAPRAASPPRTVRGSRLPPDWMPTDTDVAYAEQHGVDWRRAAERFRNHWTAKAGKGGVMLDWAATWRNWVLRDAEQPKPKLHTLPLEQQNRRILAAAGLGFVDPPPIVEPVRRIAQ